MVIDRHLFWVGCYYVGLHVQHFISRTEAMRKFTKDEKDFINDNLFTCSPEAIATILRCDKICIVRRFQKHKRMKRESDIQFILNNRHMMRKELIRITGTNHSFVYKVLRQLAKKHYATINQS
jgi:hypothetical protein